MFLWQFESVTHSFLKNCKQKIRLIAQNFDDGSILGNYDVQNFPKFKCSFCGLQNGVKNMKIIDFESYFVFLCPVNIPMDSINE